MLSCTYAAGFFSFLHSINDGAGYVRNFSLINMKQGRIWGRIFAHHPISTPQGLVLSDLQGKSAWRAVVRASQLCSKKKKKKRWVFLRRIRGFSDTLKSFHCIAFSHELVQDPTISTFSLKTKLSQISLVTLLVFVCLKLKMQNPTYQLHFS